MQGIFEYQVNLQDVYFRSMFFLAHTLFDIILNILVVVIPQLWQHRQNIAHTNTYHIAYYLTQGVSSHHQHDI